MERRYTPHPTKVEARADGGKEIVGYAAVFYREGDAGTEYRLYDDLVERIMPGAFDEAVDQRHDVRALFNHDPSMVLGRAEASTLRIDTDATGLRYSISPPNTQAGRDVVELLERGDVSGSSFAFIPTRVSWEERMDKNTKKVEYIRKIENVRLIDVGPVTYPAYESTTAGVRSADQAQDAVEELRKYRMRKQSVEVRLREISLDIDQITL